VGINATVPVNFDGQTDLINEVYPASDRNLDGSATSLRNFTILVKTRRHVEKIIQ
jgi:hypothetical protein